MERAVPDRPIYQAVAWEDYKKLSCALPEPQTFRNSHKKAKAIITDEGGITSHAAIVSRELGIPCIIGTKLATQVLATGDIIEMDTSKGIIKKMS